MGQFKPMVKMMTTEPSVILKLKKGGPVKKAMGGTMGQRPLTTPGKPMPPNPVSRPPTTPGKPMPSYPVSRPLAGPRGSGPNDAGPMGPRGPKNPGPMPKPRGGTYADPKPNVMPRPVRDKGLGNEMPAAMAGLKPAMKNGGGFETAKMHAKEKKAVSNVEKKLSKHADMPASKAHKGLKTGGVVKGQGGYKTGGVVNGQGGYKNGGAAKKHYATGGVVDSGAPVAMPERKKSAPVAIDRLAGTFKKGGKVRGGSAC
jgi:hypothetical protein